MKFVTEIKLATSLHLVVTKIIEGGWDFLIFSYMIYILRQESNYGNSNISPCKNIIFKKSSKRNQNCSSYSITNLKFQHKPKIQSFKNPHIKIDLFPRSQNPLS